MFAVKRWKCWQLAINYMVREIVRSIFCEASQRWTQFCFQTKLCCGFPLLGFLRETLTEFCCACDMSVLGPGVPLKKGELWADVTGAMHAIRVTLCDTASANMSHASICSLGRISNYYIYIYTSMCIKHTRIVRNHQN